jgi:hypothetical protein
VIDRMQTLTQGPGAADRTQLIEQLARRVDTNRDGQVTSGEFSTFLSGLMQSLDNEQSSFRTQGDPSVPSAPTADPSTILLSVGDAGQLTRAQGAALLRQAFESITRAR